MNPQPFTLNLSPRSIEDHKIHGCNCFLLVDTFEGTKKDMPKNMAIIYYFGGHWGGDAFSWDVLANFCIFLFHPCSHFEKYVDHSHSTCVFLFSCKNSKVFESTKTSLKNIK